MKKYLWLFIVLLIITGCGKKYDPYEVPEEVIIELNDNVFRVYDEHKSQDLVKSSNVDITSNELIKTDEIGKHIYTLTYTYNKKEYKYDVEYEVIDDVPPTFIYSPLNINVVVGEDVIICDRIQYADNYDVDIECEITGDYDLNQIGTYEYDVTIRDSSGNESYDHNNLNVLEELPASKPRVHNYVYMSDIMKFKNENTAIGIDVSRWQGNVDFNKVKDAGIEFVIMRMGYQKDEFDNYENDIKFDEYYQQAKDAGLDVSIYVYANSSTKEGAIKAANWIIENLNGDKLDLPIAFDWEDWTDFNSYHMSLHTLSDCYLAFEKTLQDNGYDAMLYSSKYYLEHIWERYENSNVWLAQYYAEPTFEGDFILWQMTDEGVIDGITDNTVDIDILYKKK